MEKESPEPRVVAIIAAYNEADVIDAVIGDLVRQRVDVYFVDNRSTDDTRLRAEAWVGRGVLAVETFPPETVPGAEGKFDWAGLLRRKEELALELDADWFIHHDADEFREGPWEGVDLRASIARVDAAGFNAIDFAVLNFRPEDESFVPGSDPRGFLSRYEPGETWDLRQVKCWKRTVGVRPDLVTKAGHEVLFADLKVFPIRFQLLHFPIRSREHARRKVEQDRRPRFLQAERDKGWHVQYDEPVEALRWTREQLLDYDPVAVHIDLAVHNRLAEELRHRLGETEGRLFAARQEADEARRKLAALTLERNGSSAGPVGLQRELELARDEVEERARQLEDLECELAELRRSYRVLEREVEEFRAAPRVTREREAVLQARILELEQYLEEKEAILQGILGSTSWRLTSPIRRVSERLRARSAGRRASSSDDDGPSGSTSS